MRREITNGSVEKAFLFRAPPQRERSGCILETDCTLTPLQAVPLFNGIVPLGHFCRVFLGKLNQGLGSMYDTIITTNGMCDLFKSVTKAY